MFLASSIAAFLRETRLVQLIEDDEIVVVTPEGARFYGADGEEVEREEIEVDWDDEGAEKAGYETFMLKEIYEQPDAVAETIGDRIRHGRLELEGIGLSDDELRELQPDRDRRLRHGVPRGRRRPVRDRRVGARPRRARHRERVAVPQPGPEREDTLVIGITQSGETADTIAAMRLARECGARTLAITNMMGTQITREVDAVLYTRAGLEMGVARVEDVHGAGRPLLPPRAEARAGARDAARGGDRGLLAEVESLPDKICAVPRRPAIRSRRSPSGTTTSRSSSTSAATSGCRSASRAR